MPSCRRRSSIHATIASPRAPAAASKRMFPTGARPSGTGVPKPPPGSRTAARISTLCVPGRTAGAAATPAPPASWIAGHSNTIGKRTRARTAGRPVPAASRSSGTERRPSGPSAASPPSAPVARRQVATLPPGRARNGTSS